jgi:hypothetical protein
MKLKSFGKASSILEVKMRKYIVVLLGIVVIAFGFVFSGCNDDDPPCDGDCKKHLDGVISYCSNHDCYVTAYKSGSCNCR